MRYYPALLDIRNRNCLVIGGGRVGTRKVKGLLKCGASVTVISIDVTEELSDLAGNGDIRLIRRHFQVRDLDDNFMVIGATDDRRLNKQIHAEAQRRNLLCNIADQPDVCNFILPSVINRGDLIIAVSTSGKSPAYAKTLRKKLEKEFGEEYGQFLVLMGAIRKKLLSCAHEPEAHKPLFEKLIDGGMLNLVADMDVEKIDALLYSVLGDGYQYMDLIENQ